MSVAPTSTRRIAPQTNAAAEPSAVRAGRQVGTQAVRAMYPGATDVRLSVAEARPDRGSLHLKGTALVDGVRKPVQVFLEGAKPGAKADALSGLAATDDQPGSPHAQLAPGGAWSVGVVSSAAELQRRSLDERLSNALAPAQQQDFKRGELKDEPANFINAQEMSGLIGEAHDGWAKMTSTGRSALEALKARWDGRSNVPDTFETVTAPKTDARPGGKVTLSRQALLQLNRALAAQD